MRKCKSNWSWTLAEASQPAIAWTEGTVSRTAAQNALYGGGRRESVS